MGSSRGYLPERRASVRIARRARGGPLSSLGPYELEAALGGGPLGVVWRASRDGGEAVALRVLPEETPGAVLEDVLQDVRRAEKVVHRGLVRVVDVVLDGGRLAVATELLDGESLARRLEREPPTSEEAVRVVGELLAGLAHVHGFGLVHGRVRPSSVFCCKDGRIVLLHLGLAKAAAPTADDAAWTAPEGPGAPSADVYAVGLVARSLGAGAPRWLARFVDELVQDDPALRPRDAVVALERFEQAPSRPETPPGASRASRPAPRPTWKPSPASTWTDMAPDRETSGSMPVPPEAGPPPGPSPTAPTAPTAPTSAAAWAPIAFGGVAVVAVLLLAASRC